MSALQRRLDAINASSTAAGPSMPPPKTLERAKTAGQVPQSTPSNCNASASVAQSNALDQTGMGVRDVAPAIRHGLQAHQQCTLKSMQRFLLHAGKPTLTEEQLVAELEANTETAKEIAAKDTVVELLGKLKNAVINGPESAMYKPYINLTNEILAQCAVSEGRPQNEDQTPDIICVCNDPEVIYGTHAGKITYRKPDLVYIRWGGVKVDDVPAASWHAARKGVERSLGTKVSLKLDWDQVLLVDELKRTALKAREVENLQAYAPSVGATVPYAAPGVVDEGKSQYVPPLAAADDAVPSIGSKRKMAGEESATTSEAKRQKTGENTANPKPQLMAKENDSGRPAPIVQMGTYASEMLSVNGLNRTHAFGMLTQNDWTWIWYFDSAGAIQTQGLNIFAHTTDFVLVLMLLLRFELPQWGFSEGTNSAAKLAMITGVPEPQPFKTDAPSGPAGGTRQRVAMSGVVPLKVAVEGIDERGARKVMVADPTRVVHSTSPVLRGRRTVVYDAADPDAQGVKYVAKWSYPQTARENEAKVVWAARSIVQGNKTALGTLPEVVAFKDFAHVSTDIIRECLRRADDPEQTLVDATHHGERIFRCIFEKKLEPLTYLNGLEFVRGISNCIECHYLLWVGNSEFWVEHTDPSFANFAVDPVTLAVVLRDFDLARLVRIGSRDEPQGTERTGTVPFMALDLLTPEYWEGKLERLYRHDLEGIVWVVAYYAWAYNAEGQLVVDSLVANWLTADYSMCLKEKTTFLHGRWLKVPPVSPDADILRYAKRLLGWLYRGEVLRNNARVSASLAKDDSDPEDDEIDPSHANELPSRRDARRDFTALWTTTKRIREKAQNVPLTPERVEYFKRRDAQLKARKTRKGRTTAKAVGQDDPADAAPKGKEVETEPGVQAPSIYEQRSKGKEVSRVVNADVREREGSDHSDGREQEGTEDGREDGREDDSVPDGNEWEEEEEVADDETDAMSATFAVRLHGSDNADHVARSNHDLHDE